VLKAVIERVDCTPRRLDLVDALNIGEQHGWREIQAEMYYRVLCEAARGACKQETKIHTYITFQSHLPSRLDDRQKSCIMQGYFSLTLAGNKIFSSVAANEWHVGINYNPNISTRAFNLGPSWTPPVDVIARLMQMRDVSHLNSYKTEIDGLLERLRRELPVYFLGESNDVRPDVS
jgi:hypothetical protein